MTTPAPPANTGTTVVNFGRMQTAQVNFTKEFGTLESRLNGLITDLRRTLEDWTGDAQSTFQDFERQRNESSGQVAGVLQALATVIRDAHDNFKGAEDRNTQMWTGGR